MKYYLFILIVFIFLILFILIGNQYRKILKNKLQDAALKNDYVTYSKIRKQLSTRLILHPFTLSFWDLNMSISQNNIDEVNKMASRFDYFKMKDTQAITVYNKLFYYYLFKEDEEKTLKYYELLKSFLDEKQVHDLDIYYDTYIKHDYKYLDEVLMIYNSKDRKDSYNLEILINKMKQNKDNDK